MLVCSAKAICEKTHLRAEQAAGLGIIEPHVSGVGWLDNRYDPVMPQQAEQARSGRQIQLRI
jgi:hypothetical protein